MQMTTREAIKQALESLSHSYDIVPSNFQGAIIQAASLLCEQYGFKMGQFFDVEETA